VIGPNASIVLGDFFSLEYTASQLGQEINVNMKKIDLRGVKSEDCMQDHGGLSVRSAWWPYTQPRYTLDASLPEMCSLTVILLGTPRSAGQHLDVVLEGKKKEPMYHTTACVCCETC